MIKSGSWSLESRELKGKGMFGPEAEEDADA